MKIVHLLWSLGTGGVETMLVDIMNEQVNFEEIHLVIINDEINKTLFEKLDKRIYVHRIGRTPGSRSPWPILKLNFVLRRINPNILHCHLDDQTKLVWGHYKMVRTIHNTHSSCNDFYKYKKLFCISEAVKEHITTQGFPDGIVVFNGIHSELINCSPKSLIENTEKKRFVCVGRLHEDKGQRVLIKAVDELVNRRNILGFSIDLIGDGPLREELEQEVSKKNLNSFVHFLGMKPRDWFYPRLCEYDLFIMPSVSEGFGLTLAEAVAAKLPVITSDLPGPMEVINNGRLGKYFHTDDASDLADKISDFLVQGKNQNEIEEAYQYVKERFDVRKTAEMYLNEYKKVI